MILLVLVHVICLVVSHCSPLPPVCPPTVLKRCQPPKTLVSKARAVARARGNKEGLVEVEARLQRITGDLQISMLTDIKKGQRSRPERDTPRPKESKVAGRLMLRLGRVRFDKLHEGDIILGEGTFGVVMSGQYMGDEVAIKKARGLVRDPTVLDSLR